MRHKLLVWHLSLLPEPPQRGNTATTLRTKTHPFKQDPPPQTVLPHPRKLLKQMKSGYVSPGLQINLTFPIAR